jgi:hypothetical protein
MTGFCNFAGAVAALSLTALGAAPAMAQTAPRPTIIAPYEVAAALQRLGMRPLASPQQRGWVWIAPAITRDGERVRVAVRVGTGQVVDVDELGPGPLRPPRPIASVPQPQGPRVITHDGRQIEVAPAPRIAARPVEQKPLAAPVPKPRPAIPAETQRETTSPRQATMPASPPAANPAPNPAPSAFPPVQGLE